jgi:hypothetical protein
MLNAMSFRTIDNEVCIASVGYHYNRISKDGNLAAAKYRLATLQTDFRRISVAESS